MTLLMIDHAHWGLVAFVLCHQVDVDLDADGSLRKIPTAVSGVRQVCRIMSPDNSRRRFLLQKSHQRPRLPWCYACLLVRAPLVPAPTGKWACSVAGKGPVGYLALTTGAAI